MPVKLLVLCAINNNKNKPSVHISPDKETSTTSHHFPLIESIYRQPEFFRHWPFSGGSTVLVYYQTRFCLCTNSWMASETALSWDLAWCLVVNKVFWEEIGSSYSSLWLLGRPKRTKGKKGNFFLCNCRLLKTAARMKMKSCRSL